MGVDISTEILELRSVKEEWEVDTIRKALRITENVYERLKAMELQRLRERDVAALVYKWFIEDGLTASLLIQ